VGPNFQILSPAFFLSLCKWALPVIPNLPTPIPSVATSKSRTASAAAACPWPSSQRRLPLAELAALPAPGQGRSAARPGRGRRYSPPRACAQARRRPHVPKLARARTCSISLCPPLAHLAAAELVGPAPPQDLASLPWPWPELGQSWPRQASSELGWSLARAGRVWPCRS
jgi:hypothetical protein